MNINFVIIESTPVFATKSSCALSNLNELELWHDMANILVNLPHQLFMCRNFGLVLVGLFPAFVFLHNLGSRSCVSISHDKNPITHTST